MTTNITLKNLKTEIAKQFYSSFSTDSFYILASNYFNENDLEDTYENQVKMLQQTVFGKKVNLNDVAFLIPRVFWTTETVYTEYDHRVDLTDKNFYTIVPSESEQGDYHVFKCLKNNYGSPSTVKPTFSFSFLEQNRLYETLDGYVWKYMFTVPYSLVRKFGNTSFFPILRSSIVENAASTGIQYIKIENREQNRGYQKIDGRILALQTGTEFTRFFIEEIVTSNQLPLFSASASYVTNAFFIEKQVGLERVARQYTIVGSGETITTLITGSPTNTFYIDVVGYSAADLSVVSNDRFSVLPRIIIEGDGDNCQAIPILTNGRIVDIEVLNEGFGYQNATARILTDSLFPDNTCILTPILQAKNGHGSNPIEELFAKNICVSTIFTNVTDTLPRSSYTSILLVKNPEIESVPINFDNRLKLTCADVTNLFVGEIVSQINGARGVIDEIDGLDVYLTNYIGSFAETFVIELPLDAQTVGSFDINSIDYSPYFTKERLRLKVTGNTSSIQIGSLITKGGIENPDAEGIVQRVTLDSVYLINTTGVFLAEDLLDQQGLIVEEVSTSYYSKLTGDVLHISQFDQVIREEDTAERFKIIIDF
jgi:hypothetical protein